MLEIIKSTTFKGFSKIGTDVVKGFDATIDETNPEALSFNGYVTNYKLYKDNRAAVTADQTAFEDAVYLFQEALLAEQAAQ